MRTPDAELIRGLSAARLVELTGVHGATARRWRAGAAIPEPCRRLLAMSANRLLGLPSWRGWVINHDGVLCSPENWTYTAGEVLALTLLRAQLADALATVRKLRALDDQPKPGALTANFANVLTG